MGFRYYRLIFLLAVEDARSSLGWNWTTLLPSFFSFLIGSILYLLFRGWSELLEEWIVFGAFTIAPFVLLAFTYLLFHLVATPPKVYQEQQTIIQAHKQKEEGPTLDLSIGCPPPRVGSAWVGLKIINNSQYSITGCYGNLMKVTKREDPNYHIARAERLAWSHRYEPIDESKEIGPGEDKSLDVARTNSNGTLMGFTSPYGNQFYDSSGPGTYDIELSIVCVYQGKRREIPYRGRIVYRGGTEFSCEDL